MLSHETINNVYKLIFILLNCDPAKSQLSLALLKGQDTMVIMPTERKIALFQLPALILPGITMVISPLIALMKDQVDHLNALGIPATFINSSLTADEAKRAFGGSTK